MTENLKRCPFCGRTANIAKGQIEFWAYCPHCGAQTELYETEQEVAKAWNTRQIEDLKDDENAWPEKNLKDYNRVMLENARLREALEEIKQTVTSAQSPVCSFHFDLDSKDGAFILETSENALKGKKNEQSY